jgi:flagellar protein FlaG
MTIQSINASNPTAPAAARANAAAAPRAEAKPASPPVAAQQVEAILAEVRQLVEPVAQNLRFSLDQSTGRTIVRVVDASTDEVIRQIPTEEVLAISRALDRLQGLLVEHEA